MIPTQEKQVLSGIFNLKDKEYYTSRIEKEKFSYDAFSSHFDIFNLSNEDKYVLFKYGLKRYLDYQFHCTEIFDTPKIDYYVKTLKEINQLYYEIHNKPNERIYISINNNNYTINHNCEIIIKQIILELWESLVDNFSFIKHLPLRRDIITMLLLEILDEHEFFIKSMNHRVPTRCTLFNHLCIHELYLYLNIDDYMQKNDLEDINKKTIEDKHMNFIYEFLLFFEIYSFNIDPKGIYIEHQKNIREKLKNFPKKTYPELYKNIKKHYDFINIYKKENFTTT